ncbi:lysosome membrane protein 2-like isoform X2 [Symsagittifera roscoffensis]|uniref:lysosome membrane protein 2-like isoform X2 n=1 Tax=Symsagittifera roscoffensis TaxID=84072 RepID=UPI00307BD0C0
MGTKVLIGLIVSGLALLTVGLSLLFGYPSIYCRQTSLIRGTDAYEEWVQPDLPRYMKYHMFSYNNSEEFISGLDDKPSLEEVGILSYREVSEKLDVDYGKKSASVVYVNNKQYIFDPLSSTMNESDVINVPNIMLFTVISTAPLMERAIVELKLNEWARENDSSLQNAVSPFYDVEAAEFLWGRNNNSLLVNLQKLVGGPNSFGMQANNSNDGQYKIRTGKGNLNHRRGKIIKWNDATNVSFWSDTYSNMINGTDGQVFPADVNKNKRLYVFDSDMCRSLYLLRDTENPVDEVEGLRTTKFTVPSQLFKVDFEDNAAFCKQGDVNLCLGNGLIDVSKCQSYMVEYRTGQPMDISIIMSAPHFLYADNSTINSIIGLSPPDKDLHETYVTINTESGVAISAAKRVQVNTQMRKFHLDSLKSLPSDWTYILPLFWAEEILEVDSDVVSELKNSHNLYIASTVASLVLIAIGVVLLIGALASVMFFDKNEEELYNVDEHRPLLAN